MGSATSEIVQYCADLIRAGGKLDTQEIAAHFGMSRTTLFRRAGNREELLGEALWLLADRALHRADASWTRQYGAAVRDNQGRLRSLRILEAYGAAVVRDPGYARLLEREQAVTMRVLTDPRGHFQPRLIAAHMTLLKRDVDDAGLVPLIDLHTLSFAVVRLEDAIIYADVMAGHASNFASAVVLIQKLVEGVLRPPPS